MPNTGKYKFSEYLPLGKGSYASYHISEQDSRFYITNSENIGELIITKLDTINHIIAGKFYFYAQRSVQNIEQDDFTTIDGQFDVKYKPNEGVNYY